MSALNVPKRHVWPVPVLAILKDAALPLDLQNTCVVLVVTVKGPVINGDYFHTLKWAKVINDDIDETASYHVLFSILKIQKRLKELGLNYCIYNSIGYKYDPRNKET